MKNPMTAVAEAMHRSDPAARVAFEFPNGESVRYGKDPAVCLRFKSDDGARSLLSQGFLGFGEAYASGDIDVDGDLQELLRLGLTIDFDDMALPIHQKLHFFLNHLRTKNTLQRSRTNIARHYDLGNDFFGLFLDPSMSYSCAYFKNDGDSLETAQQNKYAHIARKLLLKPGETLLDIGCGWGGMLFYAARERGALATGNTLSRNQFDYVLGKISESRVQDRVTVALKDNRSLEGRFDALVSIGMFEHVGKAFIPVYFEKIAGLLKRGGLGLLHTIGKDVATPTDNWTLRHIFPGGYIPALWEILYHMGRAGLTVLDVENLRLHYARTLDAWAANYEKNADRVRSTMGETFTRTWRLFLNASAAGFKFGDTRLYQILFSNGLNNALPMTRAHMY